VNRLPARMEVGGGVQGLQSCLEILCNCLVCTEEYCTKSRRRERVRLCEVSGSHGDGCEHV
jgi:hypothetical protein